MSKSNGRSREEEEKRKERRREGGKEGKKGKRRDREKERTSSVERNIYTHGTMKTRMIEIISDMTPKEKTRPIANPNSTKKHEHTSEPEISVIVATLTYMNYLLMIFTTHALNIFI